MASVTENITAKDTWTDALRCANHLSLSVSGSGWSATVTLQRSFDGGTTWHNVDTFTSNIETTVFDPAETVYRVGVDDGDYSSGTVTVGLYS